MIPAVSDVTSGVRSLLGDDEVPGGQVFTDTYQTPYLQTAYSALFRCLDLWQIPRVRRTIFYNLPARTSYLSPATAGITNLGEPQKIWERALISNVNVTGAILGAGFVDLTAIAHGIPQGSPVQVYGIVGLSDDVNDEWTIDVPNANTVRLNGSIATGAWTSGGVVTYGTEQWAEVVPALRVINYPATPGPVLGQSVWTGDVFRFSPASTVRQLKIAFTLSGNAPSTGSLGVDDSLDYFKYYVAALAGAPKGYDGAATDALIKAVGPSREPDGSGGYLGELIALMVRDLQKTPDQRARFRPKRNTGWNLYRW